MSGKVSIATQRIDVWDISRIRGADYNPRRASDERLEHVKQSLKKLGFILPLYVKEDGLILSGHQRTKAAKALGYTRIPVVVVPTHIESEKGLNVAFNKATNDFDMSRTKASDMFSQFIQAFENLDLSFPDVPIDTFPCIDKYRQVPLHGFIQDTPPVEPSMLAGASSLVRAGMHIPLVVSGGKIVNGAGRFWATVQEDYTNVGVVEIEEERSAYAHIALNMLAMDFNFQETFIDLLRASAYRRRSVQAQFVGVSRPYSYFVFGKALSPVRRLRHVGDDRPDDISLLPDRNEDSLVRYKKTYGDRIVDFGAGTFHDSRILARAGINIVPFEPYVLPHDSSKPDCELSRVHARFFLEWLVEHSSDGVSSVISSYMLNSIPQHSDRMAALAIIHALCRVRSVFFAGTQSLAARGHEYINPNMEPNMTLGTSIYAMKVQKYFTADELKKMLDVFWRDVTVVKKSSTLYAISKYPRRLNPKLLGEALEFEFNLNYLDGQRMNLVDEAKAAFSRYCGVAIP